MVLLQGHSTFVKAGFEGGVATIMHAVTMKRRLNGLVFYLPLLPRFVSRGTCTIWWDPATFKTALQFLIFFIYIYGFSFLTFFWVDKTLGTPL